MGSKASAGRERGVQQQEINVNLQRRQLMRVEPPLCYCHPKKSLSQDQHGQNPL